MLWGLLREIRCVCTKFDVDLGYMRTWNGVFGYDFFPANVYLLMMLRCIFSLERREKEKEIKRYVSANIYSELMLRGTAIFLLSLNKWIRWKSELFS